MALGLHHPCQMAGDGLVAELDGCKATDVIARDSNLVDQLRPGEKVLVVHPQMCTTWDLAEADGPHALRKESLCAPTVSAMSVSREASIFCARPWGYRSTNVG